MSCVPTRDLHFECKGTKACAKMERAALKLGFGSEGVRPWKGQAGGTHEVILTYDQRHCPQPTASGDVTCPPKACRTVMPCDRVLEKLGKRVGGVRVGDSGAVICH